MHPIAFYIGAFPIRWYGVMAALGFLAATFLLSANRKKADLTADQASTAVFISMVAGVLGARIFYVIQFSGEFAGRPGAIFRIDQGGLVFYGGLFLALAALGVWCWKTKIDFIRLMDISVPALLVGHAFGRVGCFLNGCCFGVPTQCALGVLYPEGSEPFLRYGAVALHPVQLYEAVFNLLLAAFFFPLVRKVRRGVTISLYFICYGLSRFVNEFFRGDHRDFLFNFTPAQTIGFLLIFTGAGLFYYFQTKKNTDESAA